MSDKRKLLRIKNDFQQRLILQTLMMTFISINIIIIYLFLGPLSEVSSPNELIGIVIAALELITIAVVYRMSLVASHRIAGPVYVFERTLKRLAEGDLTQRVQLRSKDNFHESAEVFNQTIEELRQRIVRLQDLVDSALKVEEDSEELTHRLGEIRQAMADINEGLAFFRTGEDATGEPPADPQEGR